MSFPPELWDGVLRRLGAELPRHALEAWVHPLQAETAPEGFRLRCPSAFHRARIEARWLARIERCAAAEAGRPVAVCLEVLERGGARQSPAGSVASAVASATAAAGELH